MLRSVHSSPDTHDGHLRALLDQRTARADPDRFSTLSQLSDTPSIYSRGHFSPRAADRGELLNDYHYDPTHDARSTRERLQDPNLSTLDLSDDRRFSTTTSEPYDDDDPHSFEDPQDDETGDRMSYLGPKMRFHSRAPWEMDAADALQEEDEPTESPRPIGFPFSFGGSTRTLGSPSTSPRPSHTAPRPSGESARSHIPPKRSFETINSQLSARGALYTLAQESLSATSLTRVSGPASKDTFLGKLSSLGRARAPTLPAITPPFSTPSSPNSPSSPVRSQHRMQPNLAIMSNLADTQHWTSVPKQTQYAASRYSASESVHPYANPDLIVTCEPDVVPSSPTFSVHPPLTRGSSNATVTQAFATPEPMRFDSAESTHRSQSSGPRARMSYASVHGKGISSPITVQGSAIPSNFSNNIVTAPSEQVVAANTLPGWTERVVPPTFSLISLEEARAQRARNSVLPDDLKRSVSSTSNIASQSTATLTQDEFEGQPNSATSNSTRSRGRTISASAKAKTAIQTMVGTAKYDRRDPEPVALPTTVSQPGGRSLKHKKSGFMRLFNGGKDKDEAALPPLPSVAMAPTEFINNSKKSSVSRVPVPSFASETYTHTLHDTMNRSSSAGTGDSRPTLPALQINTIHSTHTRGTGSDGDKNHNVPNTPSKPWMNSGPQSAPPEMSVFPALRLRPVSTLFSSHFEHFVPDLQSNANDHLYSDTPQSSSPYDSNIPLTPGIPEKFNLNESQYDNPSVTIHSLREELASAKLASQRQIWELEGQIKGLKIEVEQLRSKHTDSSYCDHCNRRTWSSSPTSASPPSSGGNTPNSGKSIINRPRAKTGTNARFVNAHS